MIKSFWIVLTCLLMAIITLMTFLYEADLTDYGHEVRGISFQSRKSPIFGKIIHQPDRKVLMNPLFVDMGNFITYKLTQITVISILKFGHIAVSPIIANDYSKGNTNFRKTPLMCKDLGLSPANVIYLACQMKYSWRFLTILSDFLIGLTYFK